MASDAVQRPMWPASPVLTVVLITRNGAKTIEGQLGAVLSQEWEQEWEFLVVDNESDDETPQILTRWMAEHPRLRIVRSVGVRSVAAARNTGAREARGTFVTVVDDDDLVGDGWLRAIGDAVMEHDYVVSRLDISQINDEVVRRARRTPAQSAAVDTWCGIPVASGSTIVVRRDWFLGIGGNDEALRAGEDIDFCIRLYRAYGIGPTFVPEAVYHYRLRGEVSSSWQQGVHYGRYDPLIYRKHRDLVATRPRFREVAREWVRLSVTAPISLFDPARRLRWTYRAGIRVGRVIGSVRYRVVFL